MDRSFLSQPEVVAASRGFVCIRLATYEDEEEARVLKTVFIGRSGELENTTFAILDPDGKRPLVAPGRSPDWAFRGATDAPEREMAETLREISAFYRKNGSSDEGALTLPSNGTPRLALNVAACDNLPLIALHAPSESERARLEGMLAPLSWSRELAGRAIYTTLVHPHALKLDRTPGAKAGLTVIAPDTYGQTGKVLVEIPAGNDVKQLKAALLAALNRFTPAVKEARTHIGEGRQRGIYWKTLLPVTDPGPGGRRRPRR